MTKGTIEVSLTPQLEKFIESKIESGSYKNASEVVREALLRLMEIHRGWSEEIEAAWQEAHSGQSQCVDGPEAMARIEARLRSRQTINK
jgi:antitoxin ParD1/3/4